GVQRAHHWQGKVKGLHTAYVGKGKNMLFQAKVAAMWAGVHYRVVRYKQYQLIEMVFYNVFYLCQYLFFGAVAAGRLYIGLGVLMQPPLAVHNKQLRFVLQVHVHRSGTSISWIKLNIGVAQASEPFLLL